MFIQVSYINGCKSNNNWQSKVFSSRRVLSSCVYKKKCWNINREERRRDKEQIFAMSCGIRSQNIHS